MTGISRRDLVGGVVAGGLAAAGMATGSVGAAADGTADGLPHRAPLAHPETVPSPTAATSYRNYGLWSFRSNDPAHPGILGAGYMSTSGYALVAEVGLPSGTTITEVTVWAVNTSGYSASVGLTAWAPDGGYVDLFGITVPDGTAYSTPLTYNSGTVTLQPGYFYTLVMVTPISSVGIRGARIGFQNTAAFVPVTPYRCYDSRLMAPGTQVAPNTSRAIDVTQEINLATGAVAASGKIPSTARAVTFNMTAAGATGGNNFAAVAGNLSSATTSHINFNSLTPTVANAGTVDISNGTMKVICGGGPGSAHCLVDITGYYM